MKIRQCQFIYSRKYRIASLRPPARDLAPIPREYAHSLRSWEWLLLLSRATGISKAAWLLSSRARDGQSAFSADIRTAFGLLLKAVKALLSGQRNGLTFHQYIAYEGMRDYQSGLNAVATQNLLPSTFKTCKRFARRHGIQRSKIELPTGVMAHWLGSHDTSRVIVFFHGGGYMSPALSDHLSLAFGFAKPSHQDVSVVVLQYSRCLPPITKNIEFDSSICFV